MNPLHLQKGQFLNYVAAVAVPSLIIDSKSALAISSIMFTIIALASS